MPFELPDPTTVTLQTLTPRTEKHGEGVSALSMGLKLTTSNVVLDRLSPTLRTTLYSAVPGQDDLPGVEPSTPLLRTAGLDRITLGACFEGWTLRIDYGIGGDVDPIVLGGCKVDRFLLKPLEGGTVELSFRVGTSDVDEREGGILFGKLGHDLQITLNAPLPDAAAGVIDGTVAAFEQDHPAQTEDERQATLIDAMKNGSEKRSRKRERVES